MSEQLRCGWCSRVIADPKTAFWVHTGTVLTGTDVHPMCLSAWLEANWPPVGGWLREAADAATPSPS